MSNKKEYTLYEKPPNTLSERSQKKWLSLVRFYLPKALESANWSSWEKENTSLVIDGDKGEQKGKITQNHKKKLRGNL